MATKLKTIDPDARKLAVESMAADIKTMKELVAKNVKLAQKFGIIFTVPEFGGGRETWYIPPKPDNVDVTGTDWQESYGEYDEDVDGEVFGWRNSSSQCW